MHEYDLVCIGSGPAGEKAATQASYFKKRVAVVERDVRPGGAMVNTGTLPSKSLRETALLCSSFRRRPIPGYQHDGAKNLSIARLMAQCHLVQQQEHDRIEASFDRHDIDVYHGHGHIFDLHTVQVQAPDGSFTELHTKNILISTGSAPARPEHLDFEHPAIVDADGVLELQKLPETMVVIGGGVIGTEYACMFAEINVNVTLIHPGDSILGFVDDEIRGHLSRAMKEIGINILINTKIEKVTGNDAGDATVHLVDGSTMNADVVLWALGRQGNTNNLGLENIGLVATDRGLIKVNDHYQTIVESVYAAGDVIGFPALAATSMEQGRIAACDMFDIDFKTRLTDTVPIGLYTIPPISIIGMSEQQSRETGHEIVIGRAPYRLSARGRMLGDDEGLFKCIFDRQSRKLLGAVIIGEQATELIHLAQCVLAHGGGIDYFIDCCFNYPAISELYKYASYSALQAMAVMKKNDEESIVHAKVA